MRIKTFLELSWFGIKTIITKQEKPIVGTIILTDACNLHCKHCAVNNITCKMYSYQEIHNDMKQFYAEGIRILFFCGGETLLWEDGDKNIRHLIQEAKRMGFCFVNVVTNGTISLHIPEADLVLLSIDGDKEAHNTIRGDTYDTILKNLEDAKDTNICIYMAINQINYQTIVNVAELAKEHPHIQSISFNFHTPYAGTEDLILHPKQKREAANTILQLMKAGYPIFNLSSALKAHLKNEFPRPCKQCIVSEGGKRWICGRCIDEPGLCEKCGYLFVTEFVLLFQGNLQVIYEVLKTYLKYV